MISNFLNPFQQISQTYIPPYDFHMHTTWTDGSQSAKEMHERAILEGLKGILFSEHARKTSGAWFQEFAAEVRSLPQDRCFALVGVESKIDDFNGNLDINPEIYETVDLVMASVHRFPGETGDVKGKGSYSADEVLDIEFRLMMAALDNDQLDILGHPFGMSHRRFGVLAPDNMFKDLIAKAAKKNIAIEVNSHYHPDPWSLIKWCKEAGAPLSLGSNAHNVDEVAKIGRILNGKEAAWKL